MGEWSKKVGEYGEDVAQQFMGIIGWDQCQAGLDIPCFKPQNHKHSVNGRTTHGIDKLFVYKDPMQNGVVRHLVCSVKATAGAYSKSIKTDFKSHTKDLSQSLQCYDKSKEKAGANRNHSNVTRSQVDGILLWFSLDDGEQHSDIVSELSSSSLLGLEHTLHLVDNAQAAFIFDAFASVHRRHTIRPEYFYFNNGQNFNQQGRYSSGTVLPIEYLTSNLLPMRVSSTDQSETFILVTSERVSAESARRLLGLAKDTTQSLSTKVEIYFPKVNGLRDKSTIDQAKMGMADQSFVEKCSFYSVDSDFRNLQEEN